MNYNPQSDTQLGWGINHRFHNDDAAIPVYIDDATIAEWNGKHIPVSLVTTKNHTVATAPDGSALFGYLVMCEDRKIEGVKVGTAQVHGATNLPIKTGDGLKPGDLVVGGGDGTIRKAVITELAEVAAGMGRVCTAVYDLGSGNKTADVVFI